MKKIICVVFVFTLTLALNAKTMQPNPREAIPLNNYDTSKLLPINVNSLRYNYPTPDYEFETLPTTIMTSYYDYMPGSYESFPYGIQSDNGTGYYLTWFGTASTTSNRRQYYAYVNDTGSLISWGTISNYDIYQGYGSCTIHPATGNCLATWHEDGEGTNYYGTTFVYDDFALLGIPGFWSSITYLPPSLPDEYDWPYFYVGPSPQGDDWLRLYQISKNYTNDSFGNACEDTRIMYIDLQNTISVDMSVMLDMGNWTTLTPMHYWRDTSCRPYSQAFAIDYDNPGRVAIIGYAIWLEGDLGNMPVDEGFFVWESYDYGSTWDQANLHSDGSGETIYTVQNIPQFDDNSGNILDEIEVQLIGCHNTALYDTDGTLHMTYMQQYGYTNDEGNFYYFNHFLPQAEAIWTGTEWEYNEVPEMPGTDPWTGHSVPWEIIDNDTLLYTTVTYSKYPGDDSPVFHENCQRNAINRDKNWMVQLWADGTYVQLAEDGDPDYLEYEEHPILYLSASKDNGNTWSEPIELTDIYSTLYDFSDEITAYPNLSDHIIELDEFWGRVYLYYYDDNSFGSYAQADQGENIGGQLNYCAVDIDFRFWSNDPEPQAKIRSLSNYPNPFFASTTINFTAKRAYQNAEISVYNTRGQLINTLQVNQVDNPAEGYAIWNGKDLNGKDVTNGIYFYKVEVDGYPYVNKMLLAR